MWDRMGIEQHVNEWIRIRIRNGGGGGGRGMPSYWPYTFLWDVLAWVGGSVVLSGATLRRKLSLNSKIKKLVLFLKFISVLTAPFYTSFPTLSPPPPPLQTPVKWSECGYTVSGYSIFKNTRARAGVTHGPWPSLTPPSPTLAYTVQIKWYWRGGGGGGA